MGNHHTIIWTEVNTLSCVICADCGFFTTDKIGNGNGIGACKPLEDWLDKHPFRRPSPKAYDTAFKRLGGKVFYPLIERQCEKFASKNGEYFKNVF